MRNKVAVIGVRDEIDTHPFLLGRISGAELQAEYIQALITGNYFKPWDVWLEVVLSILLVACSSYLVWMHESPAYSLVILASELALLAATYYISSLFGYFPAHMWALLCSIILIGLSQTAEIVGKHLVKRL